VCICVVAIEVYENEAKPAEAKAMTNGTAVPEKLKGSR
jgi:hypothetical protein